MFIEMEGNKTEMTRMKTALLKASGDFGVTLSDLSFKRKKYSFSKYELKYTLSGKKENIKKFMKKVDSNYKILNGNVLGLLYYV